MAFEHRKSEGLELSVLTRFHCNATNNLDLRTGSTY